MSIRIESGNIVYVVDGETEREVEAHLRVLTRVLSTTMGLGRERAMASGRGRCRQTTALPNEKATSRVEQKKTLALAFLRDLDSAGEHGLSSTDVWQRLGLKSAQAVGPMTGTTNELISRAGFSREDAYRKHKSPGEPATFVAGPKIKEIILAIERAQD